MNAMIFAAGLGTRLRPLTDTMPKALVPVAGRPLLDHVMGRLVDAGFSDIAVNVHHMPDMIVDYLSSVSRPGVNITVSDERETLLDTGGALKKAFPLFSDGSHILIHNVDILSNVDLGAFYRRSLPYDAALLVSDRKTSRYLLFDDDLRLVGWTNTATGAVRRPYADLDTARCRRLAFAGIHSVSRRLCLTMQSWSDRFPIIDFYLSQCNTMDIRGLTVDNLRLMDVGKLDTLAEAEHFLETINKQP